MASKVANRDRATQKSILFDVMQQALEDAGYFSTSVPIVTVRDLYYSARELYYAHPDFPEVAARMEAMYAKKGKTKQGGPTAIDFDYFSQTILAEYEAQEGRIEGLIRDVRGHLYEPHSGKTIEIGTESVRDYRFPEYAFDKILYIEKEGEMAKVKEARIAEYFDMAILTGKGYATEAIRDLLSMAEDDQDYQIFVFHDADHHGYNIARTLREETKRMPGYSVDVIDIGLTYADAEEMGLQGEPYTRQKKLPQALLPLLTPREHEILEGTRVGRNTWHSYRYELNSVKPVRRRMEYIRRKLIENRVRAKVIPPDSYLQDKLAQERDINIGVQIGMAIDRIVDKASIRDELVKQFQDLYGIENGRRWIEDGFERDRSRDWRRITSSKIEAAGEKIRSELEDAVQSAIEERLS